jgi:hypothetical protein
MAGGRWMWQDGDVPKRPRDPNQLAKLIVDIAIGEVRDDAADKKLIAPKRGRAGGLKGGTARARRLTPQERSDIARIAAQARWKTQG